MKKRYDIGKLLVLSFFGLNGCFFVLYLLGVKTAPFYIPGLLGSDYFDSLYKQSGGVLSGLFYLSSVFVPVVLLYVCIRAKNEKYQGFRVGDILGILLFIFELVLIVSGFRPHYESEFPNLWNPIALFLVECSLFIPFILRIIEDPSIWCPRHPFQ